MVAGGGTTAVDFSYNYDANGRVTTITDHATTGQNRAFTYDTLGRLDTASGPWGSASYSYDLLNNIRSKSLGPDTVEIELILNQVQDRSPTIRSTAPVTRATMNQVQGRLSYLAALWP